MSITTNKKQVTTEEEFHIYHCDLCGKIMDEEGELEGCYEHLRSEIYFEEGDDFGTEGRGWEGKKLDVCLACFKEKIIPLIEDKFGVKFRDIKYQE